MLPFDSNSLMCNQGWEGSSKSSKTPFSKDEGTSRSLRELQDLQCCWWTEWRGDTGPCPQGSLEPRPPHHCWLTMAPTLHWEITGCILVALQVCTHVCVCVYMSVSMGTCIICVCIYVLMCMYVYACVYVCASVWMPICMCACVCVCGGEGSLRKGSWPILTLKTCYFPVVGWIFLPTASINSLTAIFTHFLALLGPRASKEVFRVGPYLSW